MGFKVLYWESFWAGFVPYRQPLDPTGSTQLFPFVTYILKKNERTNLLRDMLAVHDNLKDKLLEPVGGHEDVSLLAPVLAPRVLHTPPGHPTLLLHVTPCQHLQVKQ